ncbi:MAG: hypothetical protein DMD87_30025 [Candidatus Rokuibacteriota bacterium]|nr:MAG: hypothetical protein DMD87_30025 [Candidatus Rokubacteria bacterium]
MLKWIRLTALVAAGPVMTLGCVRGLAAPTAAIEAQTSTVKTMSVKAGLMSSAVSVLWHDISVYRASGPRRLAGPTYEVTSYETKAECEAAQQAAMAKEALSRVGLTTERLSDGIKTWDSDRQHYTTYRYLCWLAGAGPAPFR